MNSKHSIHSSYREKLIEHLFIGELLKLSWQNRDCQIEVARPEVDNSGYDLIVEANRIIRHIQLKSTCIGGRTASQKVHLKLGEKPSGCVVWIFFDENTLALDNFLFFGDDPGKPLPSIDEEKVAKHTKANQDGYKAERPNVRIVNKGTFNENGDNSIQDLYVKLFGSSNSQQSLT